MSTPQNTVTWLDRYFVSAFTIDEQRVAHLSATETATTGDDEVTILGKYASTTTPNATVITIDLPWTVADGELFAIEAYVTAKSADLAVRRLVKLTALIYGDSGAAVLDGPATVLEYGTGDATADVIVSGTLIRLELTPGASTPLSWGFEIRGQRQ